MLSGYVGASSEPGHTRLYLDPEFRSYVEIPNDAILHTQEIAPEQSILGGSLVWIPRNAQLIHGTAAPARIKATFLEGRLQQAYGAMAAPGPQRQAGTLRTCFLVCGEPTVRCVTPGKQCSIHIPCNSTSWDCPTHAIGCGGTGVCSFNEFCGTGVFVCGVTVGCTGGPECGGPF
jgi:hypothetical protein